jgi:hypothetical protein
MFVLLEGAVLGLPIGMFFYPLPLSLGLPKMETVELGEQTIAILKKGMKKDQTYHERIVELLDKEKRLEDMRRLVEQVERILKTDLCPKDKIGPISETLTKMLALL